MSETRKCIKCGEEKPVGQFDDNWRHKTHICRKCKNKYMAEYQKENKRRKKQEQLYLLEKRIKKMRETLYGEES